jgi:hypothetical protein
MKRVIRLTESDLTRIIRRVIKENEDPEVAIETCDENDDVAMEECVNKLFSGMSEEDAEKYVNELHMRKPPWLKKLSRWMRNKGRRLKKSIRRDIRRMKPGQKVANVGALLAFPFIANLFIKNISKIKDLIDGPES